MAQGVEKQGPLHSLCLHTLTPIYFSVQSATADGPHLKDMPLNHQWAPTVLAQVRQDDTDYTCMCMYVLKKKY